MTHASTDPDQPDPRRARPGRPRSPRSRRWRSGRTSSPTTCGWWPEGSSVGLFVYGPQGGLGKSRTVLRTLADEGVSPILVNSHITPLALYTHALLQPLGQGHLLRRRGRHLRLDGPPRASEIALCGATPASSLTGQANWTTYPARSIFECRLIFWANVIPKRNDAFKAVLVAVRHLPARCDPGGGH